MLFVCLEFGCVFVCFEEVRLYACAEVFIPSSGIVLGIIDRCFVQTSPFIKRPFLALFCTRNHF
jgi:hypothetical protein